MSSIVSPAATVTRPSLRRISNAWPIDGNAIDDGEQRCRDRSEAAPAHGRERNPGDKRQHERRADEVQGGSPHGSSLVHDEGHDTDGALEELARHERIQPLQFARDCARPTVFQNALLKPPIERDGERQHHEIAGPRRRHETRNRRLVFDLPQREAQHRALAAQRFDARAACGAARRVPLEAS